MGNMLSAEVTIQGVRPLLWHRFGPEALPLEKQEKTGVAGNNPEEWKGTVLMTKKRQLYVLPEYIFSMCREAAKYTKQRRGSLQSILAATLQVIDDIILIDRFVPNEPTTDCNSSVYIHVAGVVNPGTKARNVRYRVATKPGWKASVHMLFDKTLISREQMRTILDDAGKLVGLADGRSIGYGRFLVKKFAVSEA